MEEIANKTDATRTAKPLILKSLNDMLEYASIPPLAPVSGIWSLAYSKEAGISRDGGALAA